MTTRVNFVVSIGRVSAGDATARPAIESAVGAAGGKVIGGVGSAQDPIIAEFADQAVANSVAQALWYRDDIEAATVTEANPAPVRESTDAAAAATTEDAAAVDPIDAVLEGADADKAAEAFVEAYKKGKAKPCAKDDKDDDKKDDDKKDDDKGEKKGD